MANRVSVRVRVTGQVQGVWFRAWTAERAEALGLDGWVQNAPDGSVRALVSGPETAVAKMLSALAEGPPAARVAAVEHEEAAETPPTGFRVIR